MEAPRVYQRDLDDLDGGANREGHTVHTENYETVAEEYIYRIPEGEAITHTLLYHTTKTHLYRSKTRSILNYYDHCKPYDRHRYLLHPVLYPTGYRQHRCGTVVLGLGRGDESMVSPTQRSRGLRSCQLTTLVGTLRDDAYYISKIEHL
jgi:hypothetical protein